MSGFVYFIRCHDRVKIGYSTDPIKRLSKVSSDAPYPCELLGYVSANDFPEWDLHSRFSNVRAHGEWFLASRDLLDFIEVSRIVHPAPIVNLEPPASAEDWPIIIATVLAGKQWRQADLAEKLRVHQALVSKWRAGKHEPTRMTRDMLRQLYAEVAA